MGLINAMRATTSGLAAQRVRMDTVSGNVANIDTTRTPDGGAYRRHVVNFAAADNGMPFANLVAKFNGQASTGVVLTQVNVNQYAHYGYNDGSFRYGQYKPAKLSKPSPLPSGRQIAH